jgi:hypothetical protein
MMGDDYMDASRYVFGWSDPRMPNFKRPDYYTRRKYGKYTIYNKDGMRVAWGLNEKEMKSYMKLLKEE